MVKIIKNTLLYFLLFWTCGCYEKTIEIHNSKEKNDFEVIKHSCIHMSDSGKIIMADTTLLETYIDLEEIEHTKIDLKLAQKNGMWEGYIYFNSKEKNELFIMCSEDVPISLIGTYDDRSSKKISATKIFESKEILDSAGCNSIKKAFLFEIEEGMSVVSIYIGPTTIENLAIVMEEEHHHDEHTD